MDGKGTEAFELIDGRSVANAQQFRYKTQQIKSITFQKDYMQLISTREMVNTIKMWKYQQMCSQSCSVQWITPGKKRQGSEEEVYFAAFQSTWSEAFAYWNNSYAPEAGPFNFKKKDIVTHEKSSPNGLKAYR